MTALKELAGTRKVLLVGDSKLVSRGNILAMNTARVTFIAPAGKAYLPATHLRALDPAAASPVDYLAERDQGCSPKQRGSYRVVEGGITLAGKRKTDPDLAVRCVLVWSSTRAQAAATSRAKKLDRARADLERVQRGLGGPHYRTADKVTARVATIARSRKVTAYLRAETGTDPATGKPTLAWLFDRDALDAEAATDGWYGLLTNLTVEQADAAEVLRRYKGQEVVERRYGAFKGPLGVAPMFLKTNRRIAALISVICLALLVFCLVERAVRKAIAPAVELAGLYVGRPAKPTGRLVFEALGGLRLNPARGHDPPTIPEPPPLQASLLELLNVDPTRPRRCTCAASASGGRSRTPSTPRRPSGTARRSGSLQRGPRSPGPRRSSRRRRRRPTGSPPRSTSSGTGRRRATPPRAGSRRWEAGRPTGAGSTCPRASATASTSGSSARTPTGPARRPSTSTGACWTAWSCGGATPRSPSRGRWRNSATSRWPLPTGCAT